MSTDALTQVRAGRGGAGTFKCTMLQMLAGSCTSLLQVTLRWVRAERPPNRSMPSGGRGCSTSVKLLRKMRSPVSGFCSSVAIR